MVLHLAGPNARGFRKIPGGSWGWSHLINGRQRLIATDLSINKLPAHKKTGVNSNQRTSEKKKFECTNDPLTPIRIQYKRPTSSR